MTPCPLCAHLLYHQSPPLVRVPPLRVYCDGCRGWLRWEPTDETRQVEVAPLCPACQKSMILKSSARYSGLRWGCETWKVCRSGMRPETATATIDVPVYRLVPWVTERATEDEKHFARLDREAQERRTRLENQAARHKRKWWLGGGLDDLMER